MNNWEKALSNDLQLLIDKIKKNVDKLPLETLQEQKQPQQVDPNLFALIDRIKKNADKIIKVPQTQTPDKAKLKDKKVEKDFYKYMPMPTSDIAPQFPEVPTLAKKQLEKPESIRIEKMTREELRKITPEKLNKILDAGEVFYYGFLNQASAGIFEPSDDETLKKINDHLISFGLGSFIGLAVELLGTKQIAMATRLPQLAAKVTPKLGLVTARAMQWGIKALAEKSIEKLKKGEMLDVEDAREILKETGIGTIFGLSELPMNILGSYIASGVVGASVPLIEKLSKGEKLSKEDIPPALMSMALFLTLHTLRLPELRKIQAGKYVKKIVDETASLLEQKGLPREAAEKGAYTIIMKRAAQIEKQLRKDIDTKTFTKRVIDKIFFNSKLQKALKTDLDKYINSTLKNQVGVLKPSQVMGKDLSTNIKIMEWYKVRNRLEDLGGLDPKRLRKFESKYKTFTRRQLLSERQLAMSVPSPVEGLVKRKVKLVVKPTDVERAVIKDQLGKIQTAIRDKLEGRFILSDVLGTHLSKTTLRQLVKQKNPKEIMRILSNQYFGLEPDKLSLDEMKALFDIVNLSVYHIEGPPRQMIDKLLLLETPDPSQKAAVINTFIPVVQVMREYEPKYRTYTMWKEFYDATVNMQKKYSKTIRLVNNRLLKKYRIIKPEQGLKISLYLDGKLKPEQLTTNELAAAKFLRKVFNALWVELSTVEKQMGKTPPPYLKDYFPHIFDKREMKALSKIWKRMPRSIRNSHLMQRRMAEGYEGFIMWDPLKALDIYTRRAMRTIYINPLLYKWSGTIDRLPDAVRLIWVDRLKQIAGRPNPVDEIFYNSVNDMLKTMKIDDYELARDLSQLALNWIYAGGLGLKISSAVKNMFQSLHNWSVIGPYWDMQGRMAAWFDKDMQRLLYNRGIYDMQAVPGLWWGSTASKFTKNLNKTLALFTAVDRYFNRGPVYAGAYLQFKSHYQTKGEEGVKRLLKNVHPGTRKAILRTLREKGVEQATHLYAFDRMAMSQWVYHPLSSPEFQRGITKKLTFPFLSWPSWYFTQYLPNLVKYNKKGFLIHLTSSLLMKHYLQEKLGFKTSYFTLFGVMPTSFFGPTIQTLESASKYAQALWQKNERMRNAALKELAYKMKVFLPGYTGVSDMIHFFNDVMYDNLIYDLHTGTIKEKDTGWVPIQSEAGKRARTKRAIIDLLGVPIVKDDIEEYRRLIRQGKGREAIEKLREIQRKWGITLPPEEVGQIPYEIMKETLKQQRKITIKKRR